MFILLLIPVSNDHPLEKSVEHAKQTENTVRAIFKDTVDNLGVSAWYSISKKSPIKDLALVMTLVQNADLLYFAKGWEEYRELEALHHICELYGIQRMEE